MKIQKSIIDTDHSDARTFFMQSSSYVNFGLPPYFSFKRLLEKIDKIVKGKEIETFFCVDRRPGGNGNRITPNQLEGVNYKFLDNKDGKYAFRPFELIHPVLYVALVDQITRPDNWTKLVNRLKELGGNTRIDCRSLPVLIVDKNDVRSEKKSTILNWWNNVEQQSIELSLDYSFIIHTDIVSCYSNIYTHAIAWAVEGKDVAKENMNDLSLLGNKIDRSIQQMSYGQTNGIPQGSILMDFIAELVLHYVDHLLSVRIESYDDYRIIRYRDDYRIFSKDARTAENIMKELTDVLSEVGLSISASKTVASTDIIRSSVKDDKLYWIQQINSLENIQHHLLLINELSHKFPNSGQLVNALTEFQEKVINIERIYHNPLAIIGIVVDIAYRNPKVYALSIGIVSIFLDKLNEDDQYNTVKKIINKFNKLPNTGHILLWLQRISIRFDKEIEFDERLCQKVEDATVKIWNSDWLAGRLEEFTDSTKIVDSYVMKHLSKIITVKEIKSVTYGNVDDLIP